MAISQRTYMIVALALISLVVMLVPTQQAMSQLDLGEQTQTKGNGGIILSDQPGAFNIYGINGSAPLLNDTVATFHSEVVCSDIVSFGSLNASTSVMLRASVSAAIRNLSPKGDDQFAVFAVDDVTNYKGDEFGFVLPETGTTWYAYVQSPQLSGFYYWKPILTLKSDTSFHSLVATYTASGSLKTVNFFVDDKLIWVAPYPEISNQSFHLAMVSHKVSAETVNLSQITMQVKDASLSAFT